MIKAWASSALVDSAPGHQDINNALLRAGHFLLVGGACCFQLIYVQCTYDFIAI
jgi:hypothetical protein